MPAPPARCPHLDRVSLAFEQADGQLLVDNVILGQKDAKVPP